MERDPSLDTLLDLDGQVLVIDPETRYCPVRCPSRSGERGEAAWPRLLADATFDRKHRLRTVRPHEYKDAATLLADFWSAVDAVLREKEYYHKDPQDRHRLV